jgi:hypothetical protein
MTEILLGTNDGAQTWSITGLYLVGTKFTAVASGNMTVFKIVGSASGNVKVGLYTDNAGSPNVLLNSTGSAAIVSGVNSIDFPSTAIVSGTVYWLVANSDTNNIIGATNGVGTGFYMSLAWASAFPNPLTGTTPYSATVLLAGYGTASVSFIPRPIFF